MLQSSPCLLKLSSATDAIARTHYTARCHGRAASFRRRAYVSVCSGRVVVGAVLCATKRKETTSCCVCRRDSHCALQISDALKKSTASAGLSRSMTR